MPRWRWWSPTAAWCGEKLGLADQELTPEEDRQARDAFVELVRATEARR